MPSPGSNLGTGAERCLTSNLETHACGPHVHMHVVTARRARCRTRCCRSAWRRTRGCRTQRRATPASPSSAPSRASCPPSSPTTPSPRGCCRCSPWSALAASAAASSLPRHHRLLLFHHQHPLLPPLPPPPDLAPPPPRRRCYRSPPRTRSAGERRRPTTRGRAWRCLACASMRGARCAPGSTERTIQQSSLGRRSATAYTVHGFLDVPGCRSRVEAW